MEPFLDETTYYDPPNCTFPFGTHICVVEIDRDTGHAVPIRYVAVDDVGNVLNPLIVDGQVHGGIAQGLAQALYEGAYYDDDGQLVTGTMSDYAVPKASMVPSYELDRTCTPTAVNPMGVKGAGEAGTIASTPAVANAVIDATQAPRRQTHRHADDARTGLARNEPVVESAYQLGLPGRRYTCIQDSSNISDPHRCKRLLPSSPAILKPRSLRVATRWCRR